MKISKKFGRLIEKLRFILISKFLEFFIRDQNSIKINIIDVLDRINPNRSIYNNYKSKSSNQTILNYDKNLFERDESGSHFIRNLSN
jgi:hypothetical protein